MNFISLVGVELQKIRRSKIGLILIAPVFLMWLPSILNASGNFDVRDVPITPEHNFFIQGFMGMAWFMLPATLVICTVLLTQTERANRGILRMLSLPVSTAKLCLAKFSVILILNLVQLAVSILAYYLCAAVASRAQNYSFLLDPRYVCPVVAKLYLAALPMASVFWMLAILIQTPIFSVGIGLASLVPSVLMINTKAWFAYPMSYPFYLLMTEYGKAAEGIYETQVHWLPWIPTAAAVTLLCLAVSCIKFGHSERR